MEPKVALVIDYLSEYGGAERVLETLHSMYPTATVFTSTYDAEALPPELKSWTIKTLNVEKLPLYSKLAKHYTFLYPVLFESLDLSEFDIVISSSTSWAKSVITKPKQLHVCYLHTPPRFLYKYSSESSKRDKWYYKPFLLYVDHFLRYWDFIAAQRPDFIVANSQEVARRIKKFYRRDSTVIYPPVNVNRELIITEGSHRFGQDYFICVSRLARYKNIHLLIEAFNNLDLPLRIIGSGKDEAFLKKLIRRDIALIGKASEKDLNLMLQKAKAFVFPVRDEDFGIAPIEAMSYGKPVLAHRSGGPLETIEEGKTGMFFDDLSVEGIVKAVANFNTMINASTFDSMYIKNSVQKYDERNFRESFKSFVDSKWQEKTGR